MNRSTPRSRRNENLHVLLNAHERALLTQLAARDAIPVSHVIRGLVRDEVRRIQEREPSFGR